MFNLDHLLKNLQSGQVPFSFTLDGEPARCRYSHQRAKRRQPGKRDFVFRVEQAPIDVVMETTFLPKRELLTYQLRLVADGTVAQRISAVRILDLRGLPGDTLRGWEGGNAPAKDAEGRKWRTLTTPPELFRMWDKALSNDTAIAYEDLGGRSSCELLPIWFVYHNEGGLWLGPEWSGSWDMQTGRDADGAWFRFGLPLLDFNILQGEEVQLPAVSLGSYCGAIGDGCVQLRRLIHDEFMPCAEGKPLLPVSAHGIGTSIPGLAGDNLERAIDLYAAMGVESLIFASPWYRPPKGMPSRFSAEELKEMHPHIETKERYELLAWWEHCGHYEPDPERFPQGIAHTVDYLRQRGMSLGLWYDPRYNVFTEEQQQWRDATVPYKCENAADQAWNLELIDMSLSAGRECMYELMERLVVEFGADCLWHDLNVEVRPRYWQDTEQEGRKGLKELRHYIGSDEVYDRFLANYPQVWIKWCGSGGTMLNLGALRRCHFFRMADFSGVRPAEDPDTDAARDMRTSLNWIIPTNYLVGLRGLPASQDPTVSRMHLLLDQFGSKFALHNTSRLWSDRDRADATLAIGLYKNLRHYLEGDYWSLFPQPEAQEGWDGWQFHDQTTGTGILLFFKRRDCQDNQQRTRLRWPADPEQLRFANMLGQATVSADGNNIVIDMPDRAALVRYDRLGDESEVMNLRSN